MGTCQVLDERFRSNKKKGEHIFHETRGRRRRKAAASRKAYVIHWQSVSDPYISPKQQIVTVPSHGASYNCQTARIKYLLAFANR